MKIRKMIKTALLAITLLVLLFFIYSTLPRVRHHKSTYGVPLEKADVLPANFKHELNTYITDTASFAQTLVAMQGEKVIFETGDTQKLINCHSARKSIMSLLIGIAKEKGLLRLDETLAELGIDESETPLTAQEKTATIRDLLLARSGVYLPAEAETDFAKKNRPKREQYKPGEFFFYNNFDFNVLGSILEQRTGLSIGEFMEENLARPLGMQDFAASNVVYGNTWPVPNRTTSNYPVYYIFLSARDLARIGVMVGQNGKWDDQQVLSPAWIVESTRIYNSFPEGQSWGVYDDYSYLWWLEFDHQTIWADGFGGQFLLIDPAHQITISQRNFTGNSLLSSGLYLAAKDNQGNPRDVIHVHERIKKTIFGE